VTHEYTLLVGGVVRTGPGLPEASALGYAHGTVLAVGSDREVRAISRGDSRVVELRGRLVLPAGPATLEPGSEASFRVLDPTGSEIATVERGRVTRGAL
jgi:hypothetical protein